MSTSDEELTVWVGGLDPQVSSEILWELFVQAGPVLQVKLPTDRETGEQRPFAFIAFKHAISGPYAERLFNGTKLFDKIIRVRYKGSEKFDQNKYHQLYEDLLSRLSVENPDKYGNIFEEIETAKSGYIGNRIVYTEDDSQFAGYNSPQPRDYNSPQPRDYNSPQLRDYNSDHDSRYNNRNDYGHHDDRNYRQRDRSSHYHDNRNKPYRGRQSNGYESRAHRQRGSRF